MNILSGRALDEIGLRHTNIFYRIVAIVWAATSIYAVAYLWQGYYFSACSLALGNFVFTPIVLWLKKRGYVNVANFLFVTSLNFYVYASSLGLRHEVSAEAYAIPIAMASILLFDLSNIFLFIYAIAAPAVIWCCVWFLDYDFVPISWTVNTPYASQLAKINFFGSFFISMIILKIFFGTIIKMRDRQMNHENEKRQAAEGHYLTLQKSKKQYEDKLNLLFTTVKAGLWDWNIQANTLVWDNSLYQLYEVKPEDFAGTFEAWEKTVHPDDQQRTKLELKAAVDGHSQFDTFFRVVLPTGQVKHIGAKAHIDRDKNGNAIRVSGINWDASATFRLQEELKAERDYLEKLFEHMQDGVVIQDRSGKIIKFNRAAPEILRMTTDELLGVTSLDPRWKSVNEDGTTLAGEKHPAMVALRTGKAVLNKIMGVSSNGPIVWLSVSAVPTQIGTDGKPEEVLVTFRDVSAIKSEEEKFKRVFDYSPIGMLQLDAEFRITEANPSFLSWIGYEKEELNRKVFSDLYESQDELPKIFGTEGESKSFQWSFKTKSKQVVWGQVSSRVIRNPGAESTKSGFTCFLLIEDITQMKNLEKSLEQERAKVMQSAKLASLGEMSAGIAHEINNPLSVIDGAAFLLKQNLSNSAEIEKRADLIRQSVGRITKIIQALRKFSRTSENLEHREVKVKQLIEDVSGMTDTKVREFGVEFNVTCTTERSVMANETELQQVLVNLIVNSVDAVKEDATRWVHVKAFDDRESVVIQVIDSGKGLTPEVVQKLFQPFFTTKGVGEGTGLGLSISKGIVESHKGTLGLNSSSPNTCFEIRLNASGE